LTRTQRHIDEFRKGNASIEVRDVWGRSRAGIPVAVEQESHEFRFGCVVGDLDAFSESDRNRYRARLDEVFNCLIPTRPSPSDPRVLRVEVAEPIHLGHLRLRLDQLAASDRKLQVHVWGKAVGMAEPGDPACLTERDSGKRVAELYTLCFGHPNVEGVFWNGFVDGENTSRGGGLLRRDFAPKYAHKVLQKLIGLLWHTRAGGVTDSEGRFRFGGYFGDYRVVANFGEALPVIKTIELHRGSTSC